MHTPMAILFSDTATVSEKRKALDNLIKSLSKNFNSTQKFFDYYDGPGESYDYDDVR